MGLSSVISVMVHPRGSGSLNSPVVFILIFGYSMAPVGDGSGGGVGSAPGMLPYGGELA